MGQVVEKYVFWGAGTHGKLAAEKFEQNHTTDEKVMGFIDKNQTDEFCL